MFEPLFIDREQSFQCREVFYFHVFSQFCLVLLYISDLGKVFPFRVLSTKHKGIA